MIFGDASLRRVLYTFCSPGDATQFRSTTCTLLHRLHPKNEYPQASRACKYSSFCCHRKRSVQYGDSPFPASAPVAAGAGSDLYRQDYSGYQEAQCSRNLNWRCGYDLHLHGLYSDGAGLLLHLYCTGYCSDCRSCPVRQQQKNHSAGRIEIRRVIR